jgi:SAM-dependent methyltransferase
VTILAHGAEPASAWVRRWSHLVPPGATLLDVACGAGRHLRWFAARGARVAGVDRDAAALQGITGLGERAELVTADLEAGPWPFPGRRFDAVIVTNYLWRALLPRIVDSLADDGTLIYETFAIGNAAFGKPSNPNFLLQPGELLQAAAGLQVVAYEHGYLPAPDRIVQRIVARRAPAKIAHLQGSTPP